MKKIQKVSKLFRIIFQIIFVAMPVLSAYAWMTNPESIVLAHGMVNFSVIPKAYLATGDHPTQIMHILTASEKFFGFLVSLLPMLVDLFIVYSLIKLFRLYERNEIFAMDNVRNIRNIGYALIAGELINPIYQCLMGAVLTMHNPPGHRFMSITLDQTNFGMLLVALMIIVISWVMAEGCKLRDEQQLTI